MVLHAPSKSPVCVKQVWDHSDIAWASRWDLYLYMGDDQVHWFSILNSLVIVFLLSGIVAMIMV